MSRSGNALGLRLGHSKNWKISQNSYKDEAKKINYSIFIYKWVTGLLYK